MLLIVKIIVKEKKPKIKRGVNRRRDWQKKDKKCWNPESIIFKKG